MISAWRVRLELARDDGGSLSDEEVRELGDALTEKGVHTILGASESGAVLVQLSIDATGDEAARSAAEGVLRELAREVWAAHGLPPFTITFVETKPDRGDGLAR